MKNKMAKKKTQAQTSLEYLLTLVISMILILGVFNRFFSSWKTRFIDEINSVVREKTFTPDYREFPIANPSKP